MVYPLAILALLLNLLLACQNQPDAGGNDLADPVGIDNEGLDSADAGQQLWSPAYRRMNAQHHFLLAEMLQLKGEEDKALAYASSAYRLDPNPFLGAKLIALEANTGNLANALPDARAMVLLYPQSARLHLIYGQILLRAKQESNGIAAIEKALSFDPKLEQAYVELVAYYQSVEKVAAAIAVAQRYTQSLPNSFLGWSTLARLHLISGKPEVALMAAKKAYDMQSSNPEVTLIYALSMEMSGQSKGAVALYEQLYRMNPSNDELIARMIALYREIGDLQVALGLLDELDRSSGGDKPAIQVQRAFILWELKRVDEASEILERLVLKYPDSERLIYMSALGKERLGQFNEALNRYESVPEGTALRFQADLRRAMVLQELKRPEEAMALLEQLKDSPEADWNIYALLASMHAEQKNYANALAQVETGYKKFPKQHRLLFLVGVYQEKLGRVDDCIATMRLVTTRDPKNSSAFNYLGYLFADLNRNKKEIAEAEDLLKNHALKLKPSDPFYLDSLGWVYFRMSKYSLALELVTKALTQMPNEGVILEHLAEIKWKLGKVDEVESLFVKALSEQGNLDDRDRKRVERRLEEFRSAESRKKK